MWGKDKSKQKVTSNYGKGSMNKAQKEELMEVERKKKRNKRLLSIGGLLLLILLVLVFLKSCTNLGGLIDYIPEVLDIGWETNVVEGDRVGESYEDRVKRITQAALKHHYPAKVEPLVVFEDSKSSGFLNLWNPDTYLSPVLDIVPTGKIHPITGNPEVTIINVIDNETKQNKVMVLENIYPVRVSIYLNDTNELLYRSNKVAPNQRIERITLLKELPKGEYKCKVVYDIINPETNVKEGDCVINIIIKIMN